jgi:hypothetical protein
LDKELVTLVVRYYHAEKGFETPLGKIHSKHTQEASRNTPGKMHSKQTGSTATSEVCVNLIGQGGTKIKGTNISNT